MAKRYGWEVGIRRGSNSGLLFLPKDWVKRNGIEQYGRVYVYDIGGVVVISGVYFPGSRIYTPMRYGRSLAISYRKIAGKQPYSIVTDGKTLMVIYSMDSFIQTIAKRDFENKARGKKLKPIAEAALNIMYAAKESVKVKRID